MQHILGETKGQITSLSPIVSVAVCDSPQLTRFRVFHLIINGITLAAMDAET